MANPFRRPTSPDQIIESPDLQPQVRVVGSPYAAPTVRNVAEVPKTNQLEQLAEGLATISPDVQAAVGMVAKKYTASEIANADADRLKNQGEYADLVRSGVIAPGQSRAYEDRYLTQEAKRHADAFQPALTEAWSTSGVSQLDAAPGAFDKFADSFAKQWNTDHLTRTGDDGTVIQKYSPSQLHDAQYAETQANTIANLRTHNSNVVVDQRSQKGFDVFAGNVQNFVKDALTGTDGLPVEIYGRDFRRAAAKISDLMHGPMGFYSAGMTNQKMTELTALAVGQSASDAKDASIIDQMGAAIDASRDKSAPISNTQPWLKMRTPMKEHISSVNATDRLHSEELMKVDALGTPAERQKYYGDVAANQKGAVVEGTQTRLAHAAKDLVYDFPDQLHMTPDQLVQQKQRLADLREIDPTEALSAETTLHSLRHPQELLGTAHSQSMVEMTLARMVDANPASPQVAKSMDLALAHGDIDGAAWNRLHNDTEARRNGPLQKMLAQPSVSHMLGSIEKGGVANIEKMTGSESLSGGLARMDAERVVQSFLKVHPQATDLDVVDELAKRSQGIVDSHNAVRVEELAREKEQKRIIDQVLKAEQQTKQIASQDAQDATDRAAIRKEYAPRYTNAKQLDGVVDQVFQHRKNKKR